MNFGFDRRDRGDMNSREVHCNITQLTNGFEASSQNTRVQAVVENRIPSAVYIMEPNKILEEGRKVNG